MLARLEANRTVTPDGCWLWSRYVRPTGYVTINLTSAGGKQTRAYIHRLSYEIHHGPIPDGMVIDHLCRVRHCFNPDHLEAVTQKVNVARSRRELETCRNGHPYSDENVMPRMRLGVKVRRCRACYLVTHEARKARQRESR